MNSSKSILLIPLFWFFFSFSISTAVAGPKPPQQNLAESARDFYPVISFLYGTDREFNNKSFSSNMSPELSLGIAQMVLHLHYHRQSDQVCPWWHMRKPSDTELGLRGIQPLNSAEFEAPLQTNKNDETFIYVHGFATTFEEGANEAAQIAYDLQLPGMPILYSWASHGHISLGDYRIDQKTVEKAEAVDHLALFIKNVLQISSKGQKIHLVGFSMGTYLLTRALENLVKQKQDLSKIGSVIFISADIDTEEFKNKYFPILKKALRDRLVLYVSARDQALVLSSAFHGGKPRLGQGGAKVTTLEGVTTIDASQSSLDCGICHGLSQINGVINDMYLSLHQELPIEKRLVDRYEKNGESYYVLFDDSHNIVTIEDHNFAISGQIGSYDNTFKLIWLPNPIFEISTGIDRGYLPRMVDFRWNARPDNFRPYLDAGLNFFDQGEGQTAWATHEGIGLEFAFDSGLGLGLEWDLVTELSRSSSVANGSTLDSLLNNNGFPWSGFHLQLIQYFDFNKLLD